MLFDILNWYQNLQGFELILWSIALLFSLLFVIHSLISLFTGGDGGDSAGFEGDDIGYEFFSVRNIIAFFMMFGWSGLAAYKAGYSNGVVVLLALIAASSIVVAMILLMRKTAKFKSDGTLQVKNAINQVGETYLRIPAQRAGLGKVQVHVQGRIVELDAMTDDTQDIATGRPIQVVNILNNHILLVTTKLFV